MRTLVSYDDITLPYSSELASRQGQSEIPQSRPAKKRKWTKKSREKTHNEDSPSLRTLTKDETTDRELTHEEVWDDSALIDAWDAATEEYEALNGPDKGWKTEPIHKSTLWYNTPKVDKNSSYDAVPAPFVPEPTDDGEDSRPTFFLPHDPTSTIPIPKLKTFVPGLESTMQFLDPPGSIFSQDQAFTRAMSATYWSGYWTAVYHCQRQHNTTSRQKREHEELSDNDVNDEEDEDVDKEDLDDCVTAQR